MSDRAVSMIVAVVADRPLWFIGAARVCVLRGGLLINGAALIPSLDAYDVISAPYDSALSLSSMPLTEGAHRLDLPTAVADAMAHLSRQLGGASAAGSTLVWVRSIPELRAYLADYDCAGPGLSLDPTSMLVAGCCLLSTPPGSGRGDTDTPDGGLGLVYKLVDGAGAAGPGPGASPASGVPASSGAVVGPRPCRVVAQCFTVSHEAQAALAAIRDAAVAAASGLPAPRPLQV
jgi:hypothetical protein